MHCRTSTSIGPEIVSLRNPPQENQPHGLRVLLSFILTMITALVVLKKLLEQYTCRISVTRGVEGKVRASICVIEFNNLYLQIWRQI